MRLLVNPQNGATYRDVSRAATAAEAAGFSGFFRSDHLVSTLGTKPPGPTEAWVTMSGLALETEQIRLGTLMTSATFRSPGILAVQVAQIDEMSSGRVELGLGAGWHDEEHAAYGIPLPGVRDRFDVLEEQLQIITGMWATPVGEVFNFVGDHFTMRDCPALPKPRQTRLPIIIGGTGRRRTPALAARFASEFNVPRSSLAATLAQFERVTAACSEIGRDPRGLTLSTARTLLVGRTPDELEARVRATGRRADQLSEGNIVGSPDRAVDEIARLAAAGVERLYLQVVDVRDIDLIELLGSDVLTHLE